MHASQQPFRPQVPVRELVDDEGRAWTVRERVDDLRTHPGRRSLVFEAHHAIRRLWVYPSDWHELSDEELWLLSWRS
jgi:hypothetical protein